MAFILAFLLEKIQLHYKFILPKAEFSGLIRVLQQFIETDFWRRRQCNEFTKQSLW